MSNPTRRTVRARPITARFEGTTESITIYRSEFACQPSTSMFGNGFKADGSAIEFEEVVEKHTRGTVRSWGDETPAYMITSDAPYAGTTVRATNGRDCIVTDDYTFDCKGNTLGFLTRQAGEWIIKTVLREQRNKLGGGVFESVWMADCATPQTLIYTELEAYLEQNRRDQDDGKAAVDLINLRIAIADAAKYLGTDDKGNDMYVVSWQGKGYMADSPRALVDLVPGAV